MTNEQDKDNLIPFRTKDLNQAAFIWCQPGAKIRKLEGATGHGTTIHFVFDLPIDERDLAKLIIDYANKDTRVEPQEFVNKQNNLRDLLHGTLKSKKRGVA